MITLEETQKMQKSPSTKNSVPFIKPMMPHRDPLAPTIKKAFLYLCYYVSFNAIFSQLLLISR